jgi:hypothetical protein
LGNPRYMGEYLFIMCKIGGWELVPNANHDPMKIFNKMHARFNLI